MIDGLIAGKVSTAPNKRVSSNGNAFVTARVTVATKDNDYINVGVIAFDSDACTALMALYVGDSVSLTGSLSPKVWTTNNGEARPSMDMVASAVLTPYHIKKKRDAMKTKEQEVQPARAPQYEQCNDGLPSDII